MDQLNIMQGVGHPFVQDDLDFLQSSFKDALKGLSTPFNTPNDTFILQGCEKSLNGSNYDISAGYLCYKGEIMKVDAHSIPTAAATPAWVPVETNQGAAKNYEDGSLVNVYKLRRAELQDYIAQPDYVLEGNVKDLSSTDWVQPNLLNNFTHSTSPLRYRRRYGYLEICGWVSHADIANAAGNAVFDIPVGFRPFQLHFHLISVFDVTNNNTAELVRAGVSDGANPHQFFINAKGVALGGNLTQLTAYVNLRFPLF